MNPKRYLVPAIVLGFAVLGGVLASSRPASAVTAPDSFKCYSTLGSQVNVAATINDGVNSITGSAHQATDFCTPAAANYKGNKGVVSNSDSYLTMYHFHYTGADPTATAVVSNIFGDSQTLAITGVQSIAVVSKDAAGSNAHDLDNFECYIAHGFDPKGSAQLFDRFDKDRGIAVSDAARLCRPADLTVGGTTTNAGNTSGVLVCYGGRMDSFSGSISMQNAVSNETLSLGTPTMFCVASTLDSWTAL